MHTLIVILSCLHVVFWGVVLAVSQRIYNDKDSDYDDRNTAYTAIILATIMFIISCLLTIAIVLTA